MINPTLQQSNNLAPTPMRIKYLIWDTLNKRYHSFSSLGELGNFTSSPLYTFTAPHWWVKLVCLCCWNWPAGFGGDLLEAFRGDLARK